MNLLQTIQDRLLNRLLRKEQLIRMGRYRNGSEENLRATQLGNIFSKSRFEEILWNPEDMSLTNYWQLVTRQFPLLLSQYKENRHLMETSLHWLQIKITFPQVGLLTIVEHQAHFPLETLMTSFNFYPQVKLHNVTCLSTPLKPHGQTFVDVRRPLSSEKSRHCSQRPCKEWEIPIVLSQDSLMLHKQLATNWKSLRESILTELWHD